MLTICKLCKLSCNIFNKGSPIHSFNWITYNIDKYACYSAMSITNIYTTFVKYHETETVYIYKYILIWWKLTYVNIFAYISVIMYIIYYVTITYNELLVMLCNKKP